VTPVLLPRAVDPLPEGKLGPSYSFSEGVQPPAALLLVLKLEGTKLSLLGPRALGDQERARRQDRLP
jgi:hypothetical protein